MSCQINIIVFKSSLTTRLVLNCHSWVTLGAVRVGSRNPARTQEEIHLGRGKIGSGRQMRQVDRWFRTGSWRCSRLKKCDPILCCAFQIFQTWEQSKCTYTTVDETVWRSPLSRPFLTLIMFVAQLGPASTYREQIQIRTAADANNVALRELPTPIELSPFLQS